MTSYINTYNKQDRPYPTKYITLYTQQMNPFRKSANS